MSEEDLLIGVCRKLDDRGVRCGQIACESWIRANHAAVGTVYGVTGEETNIRIEEGDMTLRMARRCDDFNTVDYIAIG